MVTQRSAVTKKATGRDPIPVYFKLQLQLQKEIENGRWMPGQSIPPERVLADVHHVSTGTVKKAVLNLVNEGYLYRIQGKGTFVAGRTLQPQSLRYYRFRDGFGDDEVELQVQRLSLKKINGIQAVNAVLQLRPNQELYDLKRLFLFDKKPVVFCKSYLSCKMFKDLAKLPLQKFKNVPLYLVLEESYGLPTIFNQELFNIKAADANTARILEIPKGSPVLLIEMLSFTYKQKPYEYRQSYCRPDSRSLFRELW